MGTAWIIALLGVVVGVIGIFTGYKTEDYWQVGFSAFILFVCAYIMFALNELNQPEE